MRVLIIAIGLMMVSQGVALSLLLGQTRRMWAFLEQVGDLELRRAGVFVLLVGCIVLACVV